MNRVEKIANIIHKGVYEKEMSEEYPVRNLHIVAIAKMINEDYKEAIRKSVTKYIALSLERSLSDHGITQCTIKMDIDACLREIDESCSEYRESGEK